MEKKMDSIDYELSLLFLERKVLKTNLNHRPEISPQLEDFVEKT